MRVVAKVQLTTTDKDTGIAAQALTILDRWADNKFAQGNDGSVRIRASGLDAERDRRSETSGDQRLEQLCVLEPIETGSLQLDVDLLQGDGRTAFRCVLRVGSDGGVAPAEIQVRAPRFIREVVALPCSWTVGLGGERVFAHPFAVDVEALPSLEELLTSPLRRLPVVMVSEHDGETLAGDVHERLAHDLCGLAHVIRLSTDASWALTERRGKEWSCYNGAVRLFWPFRANMPDPRMHPLWTYDQLGFRFPTERDAREHLRGALARRVLEASTFVVDDAAFQEFALASSRAALDQARAAAEDGGDYKQLADTYAAENDKLRRTVEEQRDQIEALREQVETFSPAQIAAAPEEAGAAEASPPQTIADAVAVARAELNGKVVVAHETDEHVAQLSPGAGPPDKILRYLRALGDLADAMTLGPIGASVPTWLKDRNVECSVDSETSRRSEKAKRFRLRKVDGETVDCDFHLKPADKVRPDMCARIYFATSLTAPHVKVGYIGRHID